MLLADRFWLHVVKRNQDDCWLWDGPTNGRYGVCWTGEQRIYAHRIAYEIANGPFDMKLQVQHLCNTPLCVNARHLSLGTATDNMRYCVASGRHVSGLPEKQPAGEDAYRAKLTQAEVNEIRRLRASGLSGIKIAKMFRKVRYQQIYRILSGHKWKQEGEMRG